MAKYHRIKDLREDSDKTQQELADYLGTSSQHYGKYELGHAEIPFERAIALARYYNVSLDYIAELSNEKKRSPQGAPSEEERELLRLLSGLSPEEKKKLCDLLSVLLGILKPKK